MKTTSLNNQKLRAANSGWVSAVVGLSLLLASAAPALAGNENRHNPQVFPPQSHPFDASYEEWAARYWQWAQSFPSTANPGDGSAPPKSGQSGDVWFLASASGPPVTRTITVPYGKGLFFPAVSVYNNNAACPVPTTYPVEVLWSQVNGFWPSVTLTSVTIDGVPVAGLENPQTTPYLLRQTVFKVTVANHHNLLAGDCVLDGGVVPTVAVGAFLMVKPLPIGHHIIEIVGAAPPHLSKDVTYEITVAPARGGEEMRKNDGDR